MIQNNSNPNNLSDDSTSSLMDYAYLLWRRAWLIALAVLLAGGTAFFTSEHTQPTYETSARLFVSVPSVPSSIAGSTGFITSYMTATYSQMVTDNKVLQDVIKVIPLSIGLDQLRGMISVSEITGTQLIVITVSGTDPDQIVKIANAFTSVFPDYMYNLQAARFEASKAALNKEINDLGTTNLQLTASLSTSLQQVVLAESQTITNVIVSNNAGQAIQTGPKTTQNTLLVVVMALLLAAGVVLAIDALDDSIKNPEEIRKKFGLPILGVIAQHTQFAGKPITQEEPRSPVSESFRTLRTNITYAAVDKPLRWIMITSPTPTDGKTTVCANLGVVFAQGGKKAVIVDGDMRRPMEYSRFGMKNNNGLSELFLHPLDSLNGSAQATGVPGLKVVTSGALPPNPAELMASKKMIEILEQLSTENDLVLVDTPPVLSVTDAAALAPGMDGVILVAKPGVTKLAAFKQTLEQLQGVGAKILGVVLNDVEPKSRKYGYYYHRYYNKDSYYYSSDGTKKKKSHKEPSEVKELKQDNP